MLKPVLSVKPSAESCSCEHSAKLADKKAPTSMSEPARISVVVGALAAASSGRLSLAPRYEPRAANGEAELRAKLEAMGRDELLALAATLLSQVAQATALHAKGH